MQLPLFENPPPLVPAFSHPNLHLGTASWNYPGWCGLVYHQLGLAEYAGHPLFNCVALDRNFYSSLTETQYRDYAGQVPGDFRFLVKAPQQLVNPDSPHYLDREWAQDNFIHPAQAGLGSKLGVVHFFLPKGAHQPQHLKKFFTSLKYEEITLAYEVRQQLPDLGPARAWTLYPGLTGLPREPSQTRVVRWTLRPQAPEQPWNLKTAAQRYLPFSSLKDPDPQNRNLLTRQILSWLVDDLNVWVLVNNKAEGCAPLSLLELTQELARLARTEDRPGDAEPH